MPRGRSWLPWMWSMPSRGKMDLVWFWGNGFCGGGFVGWIGEGMMILGEGEKWICGFWERKRDLGVGCSHGRRWEEEKRELDLIVYSRVYGFICKILMWHYQIGKCKTKILHAILIESKLLIGLRFGNQVFLFSLLLYFFLLNPYFFYFFWSVGQMAPSTSNTN